LLHQTLQIPLAWGPMSLGGVYTVGLRLGNLSLELDAAGDEGAPGVARYLGLVFAPTAIELAVEELGRRGIACTAPSAYVGQAPTGETGELWISSDIPEFTREGSFVALIDYQPIMAVPAAAAAQLAELRRRDGGPLGLLGVQEVVLGVTDLAAGIA